MEKLLKKYNEYVNEIKILEAGVNEAIGIGGKGDDPLPGKVTARSNSSTVEKQFEKISDMQDLIRERKRVVKQIDAVLDSLGDDRSFIEDFYSNRLSKTEMASKYNLTRDGIYKKKRRLVTYLNKYTNCILSVYH